MPVLPTTLANSIRAKPWYSSSNILKSCFPFFSWEKLKKYWTWNIEMLSRCTNLSFHWTLLSQGSLHNILVNLYPPYNVMMMMMMRMMMTGGSCESWGEMKEVAATVPCALVPLVPQYHLQSVERSDCYCPRPWNWPLPLSPLYPTAALYCILSLSPLFIPSLPVFVLMFISTLLLSLFYPFI